MVFKAIIYLMSLQADWVEYILKSGFFCLKIEELTSHSTSA